VMKPVETTRIFGVLQRIALCYGAASLMLYYLSKRSVIVLSVVFLLGYWLLMYLGGDYTMMGSFQIKVDRWLIGEGHMYKGEGVPFDPEGFLSTFPSIVNVIIGYYAGVMLREKGKEYETLTKLLLGGAVLLAIAYCWNYSFPINKKLWTGSFTLYTCGIDLMLISLLVYVLDKTNYRKDWTYFFEVFGKNPLFIYLLSDFVPIMFNIFTDAKGRSYEEAINLDVFQKLTPGPFGSFFYSAALMLFCWVVGYWMDKKKVYVRV
jgi:predicted acyltransferase